MVHPGCRAGVFFRRNGDALPGGLELGGVWGWLWLGARGNHWDRQAGGVLAGEADIFANNPLGGDGEFGGAGLGVAGNCDGDQQENPRLVDVVEDAAVGAGGEVAAGGGPDRVPDLKAFWG